MTTLFSPLRELRLEKLSEECTHTDYIHSDNDFITANGIQDGVPYADPYATGTGLDVRKLEGA